MENYIVSARKYRPATFESVVGQRALTITLKNAIATGKLAHAYLFCGPRGVGKTTCARIFAKTINCQTPTAEGEACNQCESCLAFNEQRSYNIHELDAASNNSVEDNSQDIGDVVSRVTMLEGQLQKVLDDIKSGRLVNAGAAGGQAAVQQQTPKKPVVKRVYDAVPEDVKAIAAGWKDIIATIDDPVNQTFLQAAHVTLAEDGISLEIMVESLSAYNSLSRQEVMESIENVIEERTGVRVSIKVTKLNDDEDFHSRFVDLKELVGIDIEVDDKEELI